MIRKEDRDFIRPLFIQGSFWFTLVLWGAWAARGARQLALDVHPLAIVILLILLVAAGVLALLLHTRHGLRLYASAVYAVLMIGVFSFALTSESLLFALIFTLTTAFLLALSPRVYIQNIVLAIAMVGIGIQAAEFASFGLLFFALILLAVYDLAAVRVSGQMIRLARMVLTAHVPALFILPYRIRDSILHVKSFRPGSRAVFFGAGDILIPAALISAAPNRMMALAVIVGTMAGFFALILVFGNARNPKPMPGLPYITVGIALALGLAKIWV